MSKYTISGLKFHKGHEGEPLAQCNILRDGKKVAEYSDGDHGGECTFHWLDYGAPKLPVPVTQYDGKILEWPCTPEEALLRQHIRGMTYDLFGDGKLREMSLDIFISEMIDAQQKVAQEKRWCKKATLFRVKGDPQGEWRTIKQVFTDQIKAWIIGKYGNSVEAIMNERYI